MSRPSFPSRNSGIVDIGPYLGRPPEPLLQVTPPAKEPRSRLRDAGMFLGGVSMLLLSTALLVFALRTTERPQPIVDANARLPEKVAKAAPATEEPSAPVVPEEEPAEAVAPTPEVEEPAPRVRPSAATTAPRRIERAEEPESPEPEPGPRTLDSLMDRAVATSLPETPSRDEVARVLRGLSDEVAQCREQGAEPTTVTTRITIDGATGRVARAVVDGDAQWSTAGACIVRALSTARFSPFARDRFEVQFPYRL